MWKDLSCLPDGSDGDITNMLPMLVGSMWSWQLNVIHLPTDRDLDCFHTMEKSAQYIQVCLPYSNMLYDSQHELNLFYTWWQNSEQNITVHQHPYTYYHMVPPGTFKLVLRNSGDSFGLRTLERSQGGRYPKHKYMISLHSQALPCSVCHFGKGYTMLSTCFG